MSTNRQAIALTYRTVLQGLQYYPNENTSLRYIMHNVQKLWYSHQTIIMDIVGSVLTAC